MEFWTITVQSDGSNKKGNIFILKDYNVRMFQNSLMNF